MNTRTKLGALLGAGALVFALAGTASAAINYATPFDHYSSASDGQGVNSNDPNFWVGYLNDNFAAGLEEGDCVKIDGGDLTLNDDGFGSVSLGAAYGWVVVKQASAAAVDWDNTIFKDVAADEAVYADTNGNNEPDEGDSNGISHVIVCAPSESSTTSSESTTTSFTSSEEGSTTSSESTTTSFASSEQGSTTTLPDTATIGGGNTSGPADSSWLLVAALGMLLGSAIVMAPALAKTRR